ncbi:MAG: caspase family protein [Candidatus Aureabacteria bacterium]|nr:caspase family protein [Candidatus Auribacterota bacterium]
MKEKINVNRRLRYTETVFAIMLSLFLLPGCASVRLGTLPEPPPSGKLRVFVKAVSGNYDWDTPHENFEKRTFTIAEQFFVKSGAYEIVPIEVVQSIIGKKELATWRWKMGDWALAVDAGQRLYAEYVLIVERERESSQRRYYRFLLINVNTKKRFQVMSMISGKGVKEEWQQSYRESFVKLFDDASEDLLATANRKSRAVSGELADARKEIQELAKVPVIDSKPDKTLSAKETASREKREQDVEDKEEKIAVLEAKLSRLMMSLTQLEEMKKQIEAQRKKSEILARDLAEREQREKMLLSKIEDSSKAAPVIVLTSPMQDEIMEVNFVKFSGVVEDEKGLKQLEIYINDKPFMKGSDRGIRIVKEELQKRLEFTERVYLEKGLNRLKVRAVDTDGLFAETTVTIQYVERLKRVWAVVIGIDQYPNVRQLKYAVNDAGLFYDHLVKWNMIPAENVILLLNSDATLTKIRSALGTDLKNMAGKDDMVVIYFAGHGAAEKDAQSSDGDGLEKYLLPFDADLKDLYATALPMDELSKIFNPTLTPIS